jgi:RimJ/RimL family protein N-acetyltransferase
MIATPRMRGVRIGPEHQPELEALLGDPRVGATLGGVATPEGVADQIAAHGRHWDAHGFGYWMFRDLDGVPVARGGLSATAVGGPGGVEVGWTVAPDRWGQGYATELGAAAIEVAFERLGLAEVVSYTMVENRASRRVMEKLGFEYEREVVHADLPHVLYRLRTSSPPPPSSSSSPSPP